MDKMKSNSSVAESTVQGGVDTSDVSSESKVISTAKNIKVKAGIKAGSVWTTLTGLGTTNPTVV